MAASGATGQAVTIEYIGFGREADISENGMVVYEGRFGGSPAVFRFRDAVGSEMIASGNWSGISRTRINSAGQVAFGIGDGEAFRYSDGVGLENLNTLGAVYAGIQDINEAGDVVGQLRLEGHGFGTAYRFTDREGMAVLGFADPGWNSGAMSINDTGQIAGFIESHGSMPIRYSDAEGWIELGSLGGSAIATRINNRGDVIGWAEPDNGGAHVFLYTDENGFTDLDPGFAFKWPADINDQRWIVATEYGPDSGPKLWTPDTGWLDLNDLLPPGTDAELREVWAINNANQVVVNGQIDGQWGIYRMTIHSIPSAPTTAVAGLAGIVAITDRRRRHSGSRNLSTTPLFAHEARASSK
ncbi:hypothetical protein JYT82_00605 [bacterium AH-315-K20]|nr:hypothetical protein [bacterium AH-315-K20]